MSPVIGFAGLGNLGLPMVRALLRGGQRIRAYDLRPEPVQAMVDAGAEAARSLDELTGCDVLAMAVPDDAAVESVVEAAGSSAGLVVVHSTILPETASRLGETLAAQGVGFVDAPVSGGFERAEQGTLTVMAGADAAVLERARPYLDLIASDVVHLGPPGTGSATKLANQLMMCAALAGTHEALRLAEAYGVRRSSVLEVVRTSTGDSWVARTWGFFDTVAAAYDEAGVPVRNRPWSKDLWDVVAAARAADLGLPVAGLLAQTLADTVEAHARRDDD
jgi:3-hydroxyisobutyrate dehydrogenase-like beta-hydroxyacid dehydrogenase